MRFIVNINGEDVTAYVCYPFSGELTLDRSLDQAYIELRASPVSQPYSPFSEIAVTPIDDEGKAGETTVFVLASDEVETIVKTGLSTHRLLLCEETKKLERVICPGKTFVQPLLRDYSQTVNKPIPLRVIDGNVTARNRPYYTVELLAQKYSWLNTSVDLGVDGEYMDYYNAWDATNTIPSDIDSIYQMGVTLPALRDVFDFIPSGGTNVLYGYAIIIFKGETLVSYVNGTKNDIASNTNPTINIPNEIGSYTVYYIANFGNTSMGRYAVAYDLATVDFNAVPKPPLYITDVINQLLEIAEPIKKTETPRFTLDSKTAAAYATTPCAEMNFANGATLRENLDEIAGIVHCIPRLKNNVVYFDKLGDPTEADPSALGDPVSIKSNANLEKYATHLDSYVDNLMNAQDPKQGAISDPFVGVSKTVRSLTTITDSRTTVDNCRIDTAFEIQNLEKVTATVLFNGQYQTSDITPYVYEKSEYDLLETIGGVYPYSKSYALYYTRGQKGIDGLTFKPPQVTDIGEAFQNTAIENVLSAAFGRLLNWTDNPLGNEILNYSFTVTYISAVRGRVRQAKKDISAESIPSAIAFNQGAPRLSSVNFGERLKGETAMLSEPETHLVFKTGDLAAVVNSVGKTYVWNGEKHYISHVSYKIWKTYIIAEMILSKNFNQLGRFVSINNSFRQFEIDDSSQEECMVYEDYAVFTTVEPTAGMLPQDSLEISSGILSSIRNVIDNNNVAAGAHEISLCYAVTFDAEENEIAEVLLPVQSIALGNSLLFNFTFADNYSAGDFLQTQDEYKLTRRAPYGDPLYGEAKYLYFQLGADVSYRNNADVVKVGDSLPLNKNLLSWTIKIATSTFSPLIINKSSRDIPNITYQLHHVTDSGIIFGSALTARNLLVSAYDNQSCVLMTLPFEINPLSPPAPIGYTANGNTVRYTFSVGDVTYNAVNGYRITTDAPSAGVLKIPVINTANTAGGNLATEYKAWAIFRGRDGAAPEFILGANGDLADVYVYLKHSLN